MKLGFAVKAFFYNYLRKSQVSAVLYKLEKASKIYLKTFNKITIDTNNECKANKTSFTILSFFYKEIRNKQAFRQSIRKHTKTLTNSR